MKDQLFSPAALDRQQKIKLKNKVVMAPMTRSRSIDNIPGSLVEKYYEQRSEAGLIITEGTAPSINGCGYARIPGIYSQAQVSAWSKITAAVHKNNAKIFIQLMHTGRVSHPANMAKNAKILAPSAIANPGQMYTDTKGMQPHPTPDAMSEHEITMTIEEYVHASTLALEAGFDGVELHGANGYLIDQFLNTASNQRTDRWGGNIANRIRFAYEVSKAVVNAIGADRVGMRISPYGAFGGMIADPDMDQLFTLLAEKLEELKVAYIHVVDHSSMGAPPVKDDIKKAIRTVFKGSYILSGGYTRERAEADLTARKGDLVAFGRPFISNPKLVSKLQNNSELTPPDPATFYTPGEKGYTDYS